MKNKLTSINRSFFIILISLLSLFTNFLLYCILSLGGFTINKNSLFEYDLIYIFIFGVIVAPILETILFQFTFYKGLNFCIKIWFEKFNLRKENILAVSLLGTSFFFCNVSFFWFRIFYSNVRIWFGIKYDFLFFRTKEWKSNYQHYNGSRFL